MPTWKKNDIIRHVNYRLPKEKDVFENKIEETFYNGLIEEATMMQDRTGIWPVFELCEIDYADPILDIYADDAVQEHIKERRRKREEELNAEKDV